MRRYSFSMLNKNIFRKFKESIWSNWYMDVFVFGLCCLYMSEVQSNMPCMCQSTCVFRYKHANKCLWCSEHLCRRKVCTMLPLMMLRVSHTSMATMFLVRTLEKLSLMPPVCTEVAFDRSRPRGPEVEFMTNSSSCSLTEGTEKII